MALWNLSRPYKSFMNSLSWSAAHEQQGDEGTTLCQSRNVEAGKPYRRGSISKVDLLLLSSLDQLLFKL